MADNVYEGDETVVLTLLTNAFFMVNPLRANAAMPIKDADLPVVEMYAFDPVATEYGLKAAAVSIWRTGPTTLPLQVRWAIGGSATNGLDYETVVDGCTLPAGVSSTNMQIRPLADTELLGETFARGVEDRIRLLVKTLIGTAVGGARVTKLSDATAEITGSKKLIEKRLGRPVTMFSYPNGGAESYFTPELEKVVARAGFQAATTSRNGFAVPDSDLYAIKRVQVAERVEDLVFSLEVERFMLSPS